MNIKMFDIMRVYFYHTESSVRWLKVDHMPVMGMLDGHVYKGAEYFEYFTQAHIKQHSCF